MANVDDKLCNDRHQRIEDLLSRIEGHMESTNDRLTIIETQYAFSSRLWSGAVAVFSAVIGAVVAAYFAVLRN